METLGIYNKKIQEILANEEVYSILMIGSGADVSNEELYTLRDIDLIVILETHKEYRREVINQDGLDFDISFISLEKFKEGIDEEWPFLIGALKKHRYVYKKDDKINDYLMKVKEIYNLGPRKLSNEEVNYIRFNLFQYFDGMKSKYNDNVNFIFLSNNLFKEILVSYFNLNNLWIPKDKKIISAIMKRDKILYNKCVAYLENGELRSKEKLLYEILDYVLNPFGGVLKEWKKSKFPLK